MGNGFLMSQVRRTNRNLFVTNFLLLLSIIVFFLFNMNYLYNVFNGPFEADYNWLGSITDPALEKKNFIKFKSEEVYDIDFHDVIEEYDRYTKEVYETTIETDYLLVGIDKKLIVVNVPHGIRGSTFTGQIKELPKEIKDYVTEVMLEGGYSSSEITEEFQSILVDGGSESFKTTGYVMVGIGLVLSILALLSLSKYVKRNSDPYLHPIFKRLSAYGNTEDVAKDLENELEHGNVTTLEKLIITDNWVICTNGFSLSILRISDLIWLYKRINTRRFNLIPVGKNFEVVNNNKRKGSIGFKVRHEETADRYLEELHKRAPWIAFGYNEEYRGLWSKNLSQFVENIEKRKVQILSYTTNEQEDSQEVYDTGNVGL